MTWGWERRASRSWPWYRRDHRVPYLVVCPASVKRNWLREIQLVLGEQTAVVIVGGKTQVPAAGFLGWAVINYDILKKHLEALQQLGPQGFVFDEAHYLKNYKSQRSRAAKKLLEPAIEEPVVHCLTGTPMTNRPRDLFPLLQLADHPLGRSFLAFAKRYCDAFQNDYGWVADGASNIEELTVQLHGTMLRRRKEDVLDLPDKVRTWMSVEVAETNWRKDVRALLKKLIQRRENRRAPTAENGDAEKASDFELLGRLAPARKKIAIAKAKNTVEFVQGIIDQGEKVVVYSCFTIPVHRIADRFGEAARTLTGKTPGHQRQDVIDAFQNDDTVRVLVANIIAGGVGVNLTAARTVVFNDLDWVPANHWQAEDRAYRIGQDHAVNVYYFLAKDTLDDFVGQVLETKSQLVSAVVDGEALSVDGAATADVLSELRSLVARLAPQFEEAQDGEVEQLLQQAAALYRGEHSPPSPNSMPPGRNHGGPPSSAITLEAVQSLARALARPASTRYRVAASSAGKYYTLEVDGSDVACTCRGFEYRGQCRHARQLKEALAAGATIPTEFEPLE